jgi:hypothetical protein
MGYVKAIVHPKVLEGEFSLTASEGTATAQAAAD